MKIFNNEDVYKVLDRLAYQGVYTQIDVLYNFKNKKRAFSSERRIKMKETKKEKKIVESNIVIVPDLSLIYSELYSNIDREKINNALAECKRLKREGLF